MSRRHEKIPDGFVVAVQSFLPSLLHSRVAAKFKEVSNVQISARIIQFLIQSDIFFNFYKKKGIKK